MTDDWNYQENVLTKYQRINGNDVTIIASTWSWNINGRMDCGKPSNYINNDGVKVIRIPIKYGSINYKFRKFTGLYSAIENEKPDVLFVHDCQFVDIRTITKYAKKSKVTIYVDNHADFSNSARNWVSKNILHKIIWKHYAKMIEPYVKKFYGVLPSRVDFLKNVYKLNPEKCELLVMGADDDLVEKAANPEMKRHIREEYSIKPDDFLIVTGGKIDQAKKQTILLMKAVQNISFPNIKLIVFGSVIDELKEELLSLSDGDKIQYIGWVKADETYPLFAAADLLCFPGRHSVFWEQAVGQGIPLLVDDWPGTHHIDLGGNVDFILSNTQEEIENRIKEIVLNKDYYLHMKIIAHENGEKEFSYRNIARNSIQDN